MVDKIECEEILVDGADNSNIDGSFSYFWRKNWHNPFVGVGKGPELSLEKYDTDTLMKRGGKASEIKIIGRAEEVEKRAAFIEVGEPKGL